MAICPACKGSRIRDDYKPAPLGLRLFGVRALLCDYCNHQFRAFSPLPPKSRRPRALERKADVFNEAPGVDLNQLNLTLPEPVLAATPDRPASASSLSALELDLSQSSAAPPIKEPLRALAQAAAAGSAELKLSKSESPRLDRLEISAPRRDLKTEITRLYQDSGENAVAAVAPERAAGSGRAPICPECGSSEVRRRHRTAIERAALSLTNHKAYTCRACKASFYAKPDEPASANEFADA